MVSYTTSTPRTRGATPHLASSAPQWIAPHPPTRVSTEQIDAAYIDSRLSPFTRGCPSHRPKHKNPFPYLRDHNATVAHDLLPLFEAETTAWNAVRRLPVSNETLADYLSDWRRQVNPDDGRFVNRVMGTSYDNRECPRRTKTQGNTA